MLPAVNDIALDLFALPVVLRPSLRAATSLEHRYGFDRLFLGVNDGNLEIIADIIAAGGSLSKAQVLHLFDSQPLGVLLANIAGPLAQFLHALAGIDPADSAQSNADHQGEPITFAEYHARLFRIATGWLGWSPQDAWNATANEIIEAYQGRTELLQAIFGKGETEDGSTTETPANASFDRAALASLRHMGTF